MSITIDAEVFRGGAQVTAAMLGLYMLCLIYQGTRKFPLAAEARKQKEKFDRFADPRMLAPDRMVGNTLEWLPIFLGMFWLSLVLTAGKTLLLGWAYVAARALYAVLAVNGGICQGGVRPRILLATLPAYLILIALFGIVVINVL
eukprot:GGOE01053439.1.p1 GENE.GGOE01053439.1~~GGOE01053439.1.p1  ORF type:complete len:145 (-),score=43.19 GGOE01053439.1:207-641(-)